MANRANFVRIVIFGSFFFYVSLFGGTKHKRTEKHNATRAQFCTTRAQFEKVVRFAQVYFFEGDHFLVKYHQNC